MLEGHVKTAEYVADQLTGVIELVGLQYVTAVCTDNAANCTAADSLLALSS